MLGSESKHLCLSFKDMLRAGKKIPEVLLTHLEIGNKLFDLYVVSTDFARVVWGRFSFYFFKCSLGFLNDTL